MVAKEGAFLLAAPNNRQFPYSTAAAPLFTPFSFVLSLLLGRELNFAHNLWEVSLYFA